MNVTFGQETREHGGTEVDASATAEPGWKAVLNILLAHKQSSQPAETDSTVREAAACACAALAIYGMRNKRQSYN